MATMLWAMKIERPKDSNGVPVPIDLDSSVRSGLVVCVYPSLFSCIYKVLTVTF